MFKYGVHLTADVVLGKWQVPDEIDFDLLSNLIDYLHEGNYGWIFSRDDIQQNIELWKLANFLEVESVMHIIELNLTTRIGSMKQKYRAAKPDMLTRVFSDPKCANSTMGFIFAEAALAVWSTTGKADHLRSLDRARDEFPVLRRHMDFWSELYLRYYHSGSTYSIIAKSETWPDEAIKYCQPLRRHMILSRLGIAGSDSPFLSQLSAGIW
ncbi:hypothetical protein CGLO_16374 [Colletotrichum gloeosporioides Cg-14]|uniref:Uncharacterized protein n=1 Tax=Colletotrichum gloeosporioides (strain Cg-14) TaxID=1237896 RepID=T0KZR8_COLGC|nr:hypothetical protein CGLO_16374 [Colletotrichum gloeosporioides Cg-14]